MTLQRINSDGFLAGTYKTGGEIANEVLELVKDPRQVLSIFAPEKLEKIDRYSHHVDIAKCIFLSGVIILCAIRLLLCIPGDLKIERSILERFDRERARECFRDYEINNCNTTDVPLLIEFCGQLKVCMEDEGQAVKLTLWKFLLSVINDFFYFLTPKSAAGLGIISGIILYFHLFKR